LIGLVRIEDLLAADGDTTVEMVMDPNPPRLTAGIDEEQAAWRAVHRATVVQDLLSIVIYLGLAVMLTG
jgi:hypothetical protein